MPSPMYSIVALPCLPRQSMHAAPSSLSIPLSPDRFGLIPSELSLPRKRTHYWHCCRPIEWYPHQSANEGKHYRVLGDVLALLISP
jgi:hypothetical protein